MVQHVTRDDMLDADTSRKIIQFNDTPDNCFDDSNLFITSMGDFTLKYDILKTPQWDPAYGDNTLTDPEYGYTEKKFTPIIR